METSLILLMSIAAIASGGVPKVHDDNEYTASDTVRSVRKSPSAGIYKPPAFDYQPMPQPDFLRARYAQQQQVDTIRMANFYKKLQSRPLHTAMIYKQKQTQPKYQPQHLQQQQQPILRNGTFMTKGENDWIPIQPTVFKQRRPDAISNASRSAPVIFTLYGTNSNSVNAPNNLKNILLKDSGDLQTAATNAVEEAHLKRNDNNLPAVQAELIYVHPNLLRQGHGLNIKDGNSKAEIYVLNDLIGKNPNIQLEGLQRLLQSPDQKYISPITKGAKPFENSNENTLVRENSVDIPSPPKTSDISIKDPSILASLNTNKPISVDQLENLQKQLDEVSKMHAEEVLAQAQQEAQAHVNAQHNALAAAQQSIYRNVQGNIYNSPQAFALVQPHAPVPPITNYNQPVLPTPTTYQDAPIEQNDASINTEFQVKTTTPESNHIVINSTPKSDLLYQIKQRGSPFKFASPIPTAETFVKPLPPIQKNKQPYNYFVKSTPKYASNHIHETEVQLQAEKALLDQIENQNNEILSKTLKAKSKDSLLPQIGQEHREHGQESASTLQQIVYEKQQTENIKKIYSKPAKNEDEYDNDDLQYAAKYAFGYRIKDVEDGNDFGHEEKRNGRSAEGSYDVLLPDGRRQKVSYYADDSGYHAKVTYENLAHHDH